MRFKTENAPLDQPLSAGDVFRAKGPGPTKFWVVVSVSNSGRSVHLLGINEFGGIVSTTSYGAHALEFRERVGRCHMMSDLLLSIDWSA